MLFIGYPKCSTSQRAKRFLDEESIDYTQRNIREENPTAEELDRWQRASGLPLTRWFNTSGQLYRALGLKDRLADMSREAQLELLAGDGMLVRRPILVGEDFVLVGFRQEEWEQRLSGK